MLLTLHLLFSSFSSDFSSFKGNLNIWSISLHVLLPNTLSVMLSILICRRLSLIVSVSPSLFVPHCHRLSLFVFASPASRPHRHSLSLIVIVSASLASWQRNKSEMERGRERFWIFDWRSLSLSLSLTGGIGHPASFTDFALGRFHQFYWSEIGSTGSIPVRGSVNFFAPSKSDLKLVIGSTGWLLRSNFSFHDYSRPFHLKKFCYLFFLIVR